ncbi:hypothetical protein KMZ30_07420 [Phycicoccus sp. KQZ13P-1]|uniref:hypothetical protein n=1 Tax=Phycicoccus mangrovi TaxID=2840470 RepID=UPI001C006B84|nr:hypothetical protein [Phycicoccus mangrovi]MBT9255401.1 hypothetical protein [Phycicoccus mangrovi]
MAHHQNTPRSVLDAPEPRAVLAWNPHRSVPVRLRGLLRTRRVKNGRAAVFGSFVGDVERDLLGVPVGTSRKGRKTRRARTEA